MAGVQLLLSIEVLQTLLVCVDVHFNSYKPISPFPEAINYGEEFFIMNRCKWVVWDVLSKGELLPHEGILIGYY